MNYAKNTSVSVNKTRAEIERILLRFGADRFVYGIDQEQAVIGFCVRGRPIRFEIILPPREDFRSTPSGKYERSDEDTFKNWEQACREHWRGLSLLIKAKLVAIENGINSFEDEFLAYTVLPGGQTVSQELQKEISNRITTGNMSQLLLPGKTKKVKKTALNKA